MPAREDQTWKRQAALFAAAASALIGLGWGLLLFLGARERATRGEPPPTEQRAPDVKVQH